MAESEDLLFEVLVGEPWSTNARLLLRNKLGLTETVHGSRIDRVVRAKVLLFTGHHWVRHGENPGAFHPMSHDGRPIKTRGIDLSRTMRQRVEGRRVDLWSANAKLIVITGCYSLIRKSAKYFHDTFPNATVLGFVGSSPPKKIVFYETFLSRLPENLDVDDKMDLSRIVETWKKHIDDASRDRKLWQGGVCKKDPTLRQPGYLVPDGTVYYFDREKTPSGEWKSFSVASSI